jgi:hypothetical protein
MNTLHLISDDQMKHSVHIDCSTTRSCDAAIEHLKSEATGTTNTIIICDKNNMPLTYMDFERKHRSRMAVTETPSQGNLMLMGAVILMVIYMIYNQ